MRPHITKKLVHQVKALLHNTDNQVNTPKEEESGKSRSGAKLNIGLLRRSQPTKVHDKKTGTSRSMSEFSISGVRKETSLNGAGAKWYLCNLKGRLEPGKVFKKTQDRCKPSAAVRMKMGITDVSSTEGNARDKPKSEPKREVTSVKSG